MSSWTTSLWPTAAGLSGCGGFEWDIGLLLDGITFQDGRYEFVDETTDVVRLSFER